MLEKCVGFITLGKNYLFVSVLYVGLGLLVLGLAPSVPSVKAAGEIECPEGMELVWFGEYYRCQCLNTENE